MSEHLSREELIDGLDGALPADRAAHGEACGRCRREAETLAAALRGVRGVEVPEPSPLFWDQFSARVREAIDTTRAPAESRWAAAWTWPRQGIGRLVFVGGAIAAALILAVQLRRAPQPRPTVLPAATVAVEDGALGSAAAPEADPEWALLVTVADDVDWDTAEEAGLGVRPGAVERAALQLSDAQQVELARLLRAELARPQS